MCVNGAAAGKSLLLRSLAGRRSMSERFMHRAGAGGHSTTAVPPVQSVLSLSTGSEF